ncbi:MAG: hypothetical protein IPH96_18055 [Saprospiraceae bacterium]|nr:hypothetical protein [Saprospiraceae bacterium]
MNQNVYNQLITNIFLKKKGVLIFSEDFSDIGNSKSISKNLEILVNEGILLRVARGIYYLPKIDKQMGALLPDIEQVAKAIAEREKARIVSSGLSAIQKLGLSTQVLLKAVYYTDGSPRKLKIGKTSLIFKRTTTRNLALKGPISSLVVRALKEMGQTKVIGRTYKDSYEKVCAEEKKS